MITDNHCLVSAGLADDAARHVCETSHTMHLIAHVQQGAQETDATHIRTNRHGQEQTRHTPVFTSLLCECATRTWLEL